MDNIKPGKKNAIKIKIETDPELAGGSYANFCLVNHSDSEFVLDAFFLQPQSPTAKHSVRLVISPKTAKRLNQLLSDRIAKYEALFGEVEIRKGTSPDIVN